MAIAIFVMVTLLLSTFNNNNDNSLFQNTHFIQKIQLNFEYYKEILVLKNLKNSNKLKILIN